VRAEQRLHLALREARVVLVHPRLRSRAPLRRCRRAMSAVLPRDVRGTACAVGRCGAGGQSRRPRAPRRRSHTDSSARPRSAGSGPAGGIWTSFVAARLINDRLRQAYL
jgi:hypothetical protein